MGLAGILVCSMLRVDLKPGDMLNWFGLCFCIMAAFAKWTVLADVIGKAENTLGLFDIVDKNDELLAGLARLLFVLRVVVTSFYRPFAE